MILLEVNVTKADATLTHSETLTKGMQNAMVKFTFSDEWASLGKTAKFKAGTTSIDVILDGSTASVCAIPKNALLTAGVNLSVGIYGTGASAAIPTVWCSLGTVHDGTGISPSPEIDQTLYDQVSEKLQETDDALIRDASATLKKTVIASPSVELDLEDNPDTSVGGKIAKFTFDGLQGEQGVVGKTPEIFIGDVRTAVEGESPSVVNTSEDPEKPVFAFVLPRAGSGSGAVNSVNGKTGDVTLYASDIDMAAAEEGETSQTVKEAIESKSTVASSTTNGYIKINDTETKIYELPSEVVKDANYSHITVDDALSDTSTNPVQNKVVNEAVSGLKEDISDKQDALSTYDLNWMRNATRRTRNNITNNRANLCTAIAEQNLEKYGYSIGDYFVGASGYYYYLADMDTYYGGYKYSAVVGTHHCGIVVDTKASSTWAEGGSAVNYANSTLHTFLSGTALSNIESDINTLFGSWSSHLLSHSLLSASIGTWGWSEGQYISALTEVQVYSSTVWSADGYQQGEAVKPLALFQKFRFNEIITTWFWLRSLSSSSNACDVTGNGYADRHGLTNSNRAVGLILFY